MSVVVIKEQIKALVGLQELDSRLLVLQRQIEQRPQEEASIRRGLETFKRRVQELEASLKSLQMKHKEKDLELETKEAAVKKYQAQLPQVKTNKEYAALQTEIGGMKADGSLLEEAILLLLEEIDRAKAALAVAQQEHHREEQRVQEQLRQLEEAAGGWEREAAMLTEQRREAASAIDRQILSQYERILKTRRGAALVPVIHESCSGCHMGLPPQVINEIQIGERLIICESCARILYIPESA